MQWKSVMLIVNNIAPVLFVYGQYSKENDIECPGLPSRTGISLECVSTKLGAARFNCSSPMPVDTVAFFSCQPYYKEISQPSPFDVKSIRCNREGRWARYNYFSEFKCEYECGKALPIIKTTVVKGQLKKRTTYPWHALIYLKLNWAKVLAAMHYRRTLIEAVTTNRTRGSEEDEGEQVSLEVDKKFNLDPLKLAEIFDNDELSREDTLDPRYRYIYICGGTLVHDNMVLSAAHCLTDWKGKSRATKEFMVVLGGTTNSFYANVDEPRSQIIPVSRIHISDEFIYDEFRSDIALIQLQQPAILSNAILPACLPEKREDSRLFATNQKHGEVIGSMINVYKEGLSSELQSKRLQVMPNLDCVRYIERIPTDKEFCAGSIGTDICSGDSGGGLVGSPNFGLRRRYTVKGIISYAKARRICENYAVFTRVYKYMNWIKSIIYSNATTT